MLSLREMRNAHKSFVRNPKRKRSCVETDNITVKPKGVVCENMDQTYVEQDEHQLCALVVKLAT